MRRGQQVEKLCAMSSRNTCCMGVRRWEGGSRGISLQEETSGGKVRAALMRIIQLSFVARRGIGPPSLAHLSVL